MPTFVHPKKSIKIHYQVKQHQTSTSSFQVIGNFIIQIYETNQGQMLSKSNYFYG